MYSPVKCKMVNDRLALKDLSDDIICLIENAHKTVDTRMPPIAYPGISGLWLHKRCAWWFERQRNNVLLSREGYGYISVQIRDSEHQHGF